MKKSNKSAELYSAACRGDIKSAKRLIDSYGLSHRPGWAQGYHLLRTVLKNNHSAVAIFLLARGCAVRPRRESRTEFDTPLHFAVRNRDLEVVRLLMTMGADVNAKNEIGETPLSKALKSGRLQNAKLLLQNGADVNTTEKSLLTPLHIALNKSYEIEARNMKLEEIAELLITNGADINARTKSGLTPLHVALRKDKRKIARLLIERGADINVRTDTNHTPLQIATKTQSWDIVNLLLRHGASVKEQGKITIADLNVAVAKGFLSMSDALSLVCDAVSKGDFETTRRFLKNGGNFKDFSELLYVAIEKNYIEIVRELLFNGIDVNVADKDSWTGLHFAVWRKKKQILQLLLCSGADVDARTNAGATALRLAVERGSVSIVQLLLSFHVNVNLVHKGGFTALHMAADRGNLRIINMLLTEGATVDAKADNKFTALHYAAAIGHTEVVMLLLEKGAKVNEKEKNGETALHEAIYNSVNYDVLSVVALLDYGADVTILCRKFFTALDYARKRATEAEIMNDRHLLQSVNETINVLNRHRVKIEAANLIRSRPGVLHSSPEENLDDFYSECQLEAVRMRSEFIEDTNVSYYGILKKDLAKCMRNKSVFLVSRSEDYKEKFPIYAGMIRGQLQKGLARLELLQPARQVICRLIGLPEVCTEQILEYLENDDLRVLKSLEKDSSW